MDTLLPLSISAVTWDKITAPSARSPPEILAHENEMNQMMHTFSKSPGIGILY
jgi:hypothetical protein